MGSRSVLAGRTTNCCRTKLLTTKGTKDTKFDLNLELGGAIFFDDSGFVAFVRFAVIFYVLSVFKRI